MIYKALTTLEMRISLLSLPLLLLLQLLLLFLLSLAMHLW